MTDFGNEYTTSTSGNIGGDLAGMSMDDLRAQWASEDPDIAAAANTEINRRAVADRKLQIGG